MRCTCSPGRKIFHTSWQRFFDMPLSAGCQDDPRCRAWRIEFVDLTWTTLRWDDYAWLWTMDDLRWFWCFLMFRESFLQGHNSVRILNKGRYVTGPWEKRLSCWKSQDWAVGDFLWFALFAFDVLPFFHDLHSSLHLMCRHSPIFLFDPLPLSAICFTDTIETKRNMATTWTYSQSACTTRTYNPFTVEAPLRGWDRCPASHTCDCRNGSFQRRVEPVNWWVLRQKRVTVGS